MNRLATFVALLLGSSSVASFGAISDANAQSNSRLRTEQEACQRALRENSIDALEEFLRKFPQGDSACRALALNALNGFQPSEPGEGSNKTDPSERPERQGFTPTSYGGG
ncbi:hypothetical protein [Mesorhizobium marinum]|uniref:hypothetical protein n=1 Tax=Mesorhizobium marinum TaxID=3228790 RepID=UPI00346503BA